ncbi:MAG: hypothetical protein E7532_06160 [Ruminococcaceae bacterium]|nr:hypothetical protein [Oscillospiraceae bacterium]
MITVKPTDNSELINKYGREDAAYLIMREEDKEIGYICIAPFKSTYEILDMSLSISKPLKREEGREYAPLNANELGLVEILIRAAGSFAFNKDCWSLSVRDKSYFDLLKKFEFISSGEFLVLYLNKLFSNTCCCNSQKDSK